MNSTSTVLMVRPVRFGFNDQTAENNAFQSREFESVAQENALKEFDSYVELLRSKGINVIVVEDTPDPATPDSIFPNNWFSTHEDGTLVIYPMFAPNRRAERKSGILNIIMEKFRPSRMVDLSAWEADGHYLEGTGSLVLDRDAKIAYACRSPRTSEKVLADFCSRLGYKSIVFDAVDGSGLPIYHTNVMMAVGTSVAVLCEDSFASFESLAVVKESLLKNGKSIVDISFEQMSNFAGNMLEVNDGKGRKYMVMSKRAFSSLNNNQIKAISAELEIIAPDIPTIETTGGGSVRCMLAEIY